MLQVHLKVSLQPTEKEEVCFLFRGPGGLGLQKVQVLFGRMVFGFARRSLGESVDGYFTTLGGRIMNPETGGSWSWFRWVAGGFSVVGSGVGRLVLEARRRRYLILDSDSALTVVLLTVGTLAFRVIGVGLPGIGNLAVWGKGVLAVVRAEGVGLRREWLVRGLVGVGVLLTGRSGVCCRRDAFFRPNWS